MWASDGNRRKICQLKQLKLKEAIVVETRRMTQIIAEDIEKIEELKALNAKYKKLSFTERLRQLYIDFPLEDIMVTSSFAASSAFLLREVSIHQPNQTIHFIDTGNHFQETLDYKDKLKSLFNLKIKTIRSSAAEQALIQRDKTWSKDPDLCCKINKVRPLEAVKKQHKVWISGLMNSQSNHRATLNIFEFRGGIIKFHPLLDIIASELESYFVIHQIPAHPLLAQGYDSIGCTHCTHKGENREGRWKSKEKTECGLHL